MLPCFIALCFDLVFGYQIHQAWELYHFDLGTRVTQTCFSLRHESYDLPRN